MCVCVCGCGVCVCGCGVCVCGVCVYVCGCGGGVGVGGCVGGGGVGVRDYVMECAVGRLESMPVRRVGCSLLSTVLCLVYRVGGRYICM
jgi:hypothetical protein